MIAEPIKSEAKRDEAGRFVPGTVGGPGRKPGKTMKEYSREWFLNLTDEEKTAYILELEKVRPGFAWTMAEGNPTEDRNVKITVPTPILGSASQALTLEASNQAVESASVAQTSLSDATAPPTTSDTPHATE